jgi:hypothetical protein
VADAALRRWLREPALHFALIGAGLFSVHALVRRPASPDEIVVSAAVAAELRREFERGNGRPPTPAEAQTLVDRFVDEEVLYREALAMGLDRGDVIIRRRLVQKLELLTRDLEPVPAPDEPQLREWLAAHAEDYREPERLSVRHVFVKSADDAEARRLLRALQSGADPATLGDPFVKGVARPERARPRGHRGARVRAGGAVGARGRLGRSARPSAPSGPIPTSTPRAPPSTTPACCRARRAAGAPTRATPSRPSSAPPSAATRSPSRPPSSSAPGPRPSGSRRSQRAKSHARCRIPATRARVVRIASMRTASAT